MGKMAGFIFPIPTAAIGSVDGWCPEQWSGSSAGASRQGKWVDQEIIWSVHTDHYTPVPDAVAAGRLAFDRRGYLYISIGGKNTYDKLHKLDTPFGKIHRVRDDGTVPEDNPFWAPPEKRSGGVHDPHGLEHTAIAQARGWTDIRRTVRSGTPKWAPAAATRSITSSPARIMAGRSTPMGLTMSGEEVSIGKELGLDFPIEEHCLAGCRLYPGAGRVEFHLS